ncbi:glycosyltransferase family 4 protein [Bdellovibrionota bacterium FG-1]
MRVALISPLFESVPPRLYGGTERVVSNLCQGLVAAGHDVTLFASGDSKAAGRLVPILPEAIRLASQPILDPVPYHLKMLTEVADRSHEFDVIHNHHDYWMLPLSRMTPTLLLTTLHGRLDFPGLNAAFDGFAQAPYVSISDAQRAPLKNLNWVRTVHHGIDVEKSKFVGTPGKYLAFLGRMSPEKRPDWAIEIAHRSGVPLKMAAKIDRAVDGVYFETQIKPKVDGRFIEFVGEISESEKSDFLGNALALVFPIDWPEPFGLVMVESLACGTPVLARPCGSVNEVLKDGVTGFVSADIGELAKRVSTLSSWDRAGCRRWVEERFSLERMTEDYVHVYRYLAEFWATRARGGDRSGHHRWNFLHPVERLTHRNS